jgi:hypothetical protein
MDKPSIDKLKLQFTELGYRWENFHFIGIRSKANLPNQFDDLFAVVNGDKIDWYTCTTNPGTHWLKNLLNPKGAALLKPAQYVNTWKIGMHQGKYEAFVQSRAVTVFRDGDKDDIAEETSITETGFFGINIHRTNDTGVVSKLIDKWSAGCQVLNNPADFKRVLEAAKASKQKEYTYTLLKEI